MLAMKRTLALVAALGLSLSAIAQGLPNLYSPSRSVADQGISLLGWGSGTVAETDEVAFEGTTSIRISTRNYFQGGVLSYANPISLAAAFADPNNLLMLNLRVADSAMTMGGGAGGGNRGGGNAGGFAMGEGGGGGGGNAAAAAEPEKLDTLRMILGTSDGLRSEAYVRVDTSRAGERGWRQVGIPLRAITGFERTNKTLSSIAFGANSVGTFFIGDAKIVNDATPIYGEMQLADMNIGTGTQVTLQGSGFGGASVLTYTWTIQAADGSRATAEGQVINRRFRKPGTFKVSLTVSDKYGLKKSFTTPTITITVN